MVAPVCLQRTRRGFRAPGIGALARRRRYSETLRPSLLARVRIRRASSSVTLNVIVFTVIRYYYGRCVSTGDRVVGTFSDRAGRALT